MSSVTTAEIRIGGHTVIEVEEFDYSSDILAVGEEAHITIANKDGKYVGQLLVGELVEFLLRNPAVNGGAPTLKHRGRIIRREASAGREGNTVKLVSADLGWHLLKCCAPLWFNLKRVELARLIDPYHSSPGPRKAIPSLVNEAANRFSFRGVRAGNILNRRSKLGQQALRAESDIGVDPVFAVQAEPGDMIYDIIANQARRFNRLLNVSADGYIQLWEPDYTQTALFQLRNVRGGTNNNVIDAMESVSLDTMYTDVTCVGQQIAWEGNQDTSNPNVGKKRGNVSKPALLPFVHRLTYADPEMYNRGDAQKAAEWRWKRGWFDAYQVRYHVPDHHLNGLWWEPDTMASIIDDYLGIRECLYVQAVRCVVNKTTGSTTEVILRKPGLLSAASGEIKDPPIQRAGKK